MREEKGITLIALISTIIILLILAGVTIGSINGGLFDFTKKAKTDMQEATNIEEIENSYIIAKGNSKTGTVTASDMQSGLDEVLGTNGAEAIDNGDTIVVRIKDQYYEVDKKGKIGQARTLETVKDAGNISQKGSGSENDPYRIECIEDLVGFSKDVNNGKSYKNKYIIVTRDLDFNSIFSYANYKATYSYDSEKKAYIPDENSETTIRELCTTGTGFIPIGNNSKPFYGVFDGQGNTILNIYEDYSTDANLYCSLFGRSNGTIKNITVAGKYEAYERAGGICQVFQGTMLNCVSKVNINKKASFRDTGGLVGYAANKYTIINCINAGNIICNGGSDRRRDNRNRLV